MQEVLGYAAALLMGLVLGGIGSGGSILTVPILVYLLDVAPVTATGYSLLLVGAAAAFGAWRYHKQRPIDIRSALFFAIPSIFAVYLTRAFMMPALPDPLLTLSIGHGIPIGKDAAIMLLFAGLMIVAAIMMLLNSNKLKSPAPPNTHHPALIIIEGSVVGFLTGILGAGGGFLIIPSLVLLMGMTMKDAVGASLLIIALKSLIGFTGDLQNNIPMDWTLLGLFFVSTFAGMLLAIKMAHKFDGKHLQRGFAFFTLAVAAIIVFQETDLAYVMALFSSV